jgi:hypothetical protein
MGHDAVFAVVVVVVVDTTEGVNDVGTNPEAFCRVKLKRAKDVTVLLRKEGISFSVMNEYSIGYLYL